MTDEKRNSRERKQQKGDGPIKDKPLVSRFRFSPFELCRFSLTVFVLCAIFGILIVAILFHLTT